MTMEHLNTLCDKAQAGDAEAAYEVAEYYYGRREFNKAFEWYVQTAQCENPNPMVYFNLGYACQKGEGTDVDLISAFDYYEKAATQHLPQAFYNLAYFYQNGLVVKQDFVKAEEYSRLAAQEMAGLVNRVYKAEIREEKAMRKYSEIMQKLEDISSEWKSIAEENAHVREQLAEVKVKKSMWKLRAAECERKIERLEAENRNMAELLLKAQYELEMHKV